MHEIAIDSLGAQIRHWLELDVDVEDWELYSQTPGPIGLVSDDRKLYAEVKISQITHDRR